MKGQKSQRHTSILGLLLLLGNEDVSSFCASTMGRGALQQGVQGEFLDQGNLKAAERATMAEGTWAGPGGMSGTNTSPSLKVSLGVLASAGRKGTAALPAPPVRNGSHSQKTQFSPSSAPTTSEAAARHSSSGNSCHPSASCRLGPALRAAQDSTGHSCGSTPRELR